MIKAIIAFILGVAVGYLAYPQIDKIVNDNKDKVKQVVKEKAAELKESAQKVIEK